MLGVLTANYTFWCYNESTKILYKCSCLTVLPISLSQDEMEVKIILAFLLLTACCAAGANKTDTVFASSVCSGVDSN